MSTKMRKDSTWSRLTSAQRAKLEKWLFEESLGYAEAVARADKAFGVKGTVASMGRYYRRRAQERQPAELLEAQIAAAEVNDSPVKVENLRRAGMKLIGHLALKQAIERPGELEPLVRLTKLLLASEGNGVRQGRLKLAERYYYREATEAARKEFAQLGAYLAAILEDRESGRAGENRKGQADALYRRGFKVGGGGESGRRKWPGNGQNPSPVKNDCPHGWTKARSESAGQRPRRA